LKLFVVVELILYGPDALRSSANSLWSALIAALVRPGNIGFQTVAMLGAGQAAAAQPRMVAFMACSMRLPADKI
jgi:hypothetical protein